jgi:iron complex outermembrane receptor protein
LGLVAAFALQSVAFAAESSSVDLGEVVVTPSRFEQPMTQVAGSVTVIGKDEIDAKGATNVIDALRGVPSVNVRDYFGNGHKASVDLRGFGEYAQPNVLVLVDGRRVNDVDQNGASWTQISTDSIERIEIIRGAAAAVYGDNAVAGVINVITKKPTSQPHGKARVEFGSYGMHKESVEANGGVDKLAVRVNASQQDTNGYRQNSHYKAGDINMALVYQIAEKSELFLRSGHHEADFGLPGALRDSQLKTRDRKDTLFRDDDVGESDTFAELGGKSALADWLDGELAFSARQRRFDNMMHTSETMDGRLTDTYITRGQFVAKNDVASMENTAVFGSEFSKTDTKIDDYDGYDTFWSYAESAKQSATRIDKDSLALYVTDTLAITEKLSANAGLRSETARYTFDVTPISGPWQPVTATNDNLRQRQQAYNGGLTYAFDDRSKVYATAGRSFRFGATDEFYSAWATPTVNKALRPQTAKSVELGGTYGFAATDLSASVYEMHLQDELYYDPSTYSNGNYDKTMHRGLDAGITQGLGKYLTARGNYAYTQAFFTGGTYNRNQIPLVPVHRIGAGLDYKVFESLTLSLDETYVGRQRFINDQAHNYPRLKEYATTDVRATYAKKAWKIFGGVKNLFGAKYSEYGARSTVYNERGYYPSPERNWFAGAEYAF